MANSISISDRTGELEERLNCVLKHIKENPGLVDITPRKCDVVRDALRFFMEGKGIPYVVKKR